MITNLTLRNFKAWESTDKVGLSGITAFFGGNSSGKTSFLQSLLLLKQTAESADRGRVFDLGSSTSIVNLGTFHDLLFSHDASRILGIEINWELDTPFEIKNPESKGAAVVADRGLGLAVEVSEARGSPVVQKVEYSVGEFSFSLVRGQSKSDYSLRSNKYHFSRVPGRAWPLPPPGKFYSFPDQVRAYFQNAAFLSDLELQFERLCGQIYYLGPLRQDPERQYTWSGGRPTDVGKRGELAVEALIASQGDGKKNSRGYAKRRSRTQRLPLITVEKHVASWLQELGLISSFKLDPLDDRGTLYRVLVRRTPSSPEVLLTDVGFGVSQVLPVLVLLAYVPEGSTVLLEQPEIHLHPAVQSGLADVLIEVAKARHVQVIVESHSEHLLMRLQRRLAERHLERGIALEPDDCRLYFCESGATGSNVSRLRLDKYGRIENWPKDFFGDSFGEAAATTMAGRKRAIEERSA
jgi:predicted ATPase